MRSRPIRFPYASVILVFGLLLGAFPPIAYHLITAYRPLPSSLWDSHLDAGTCDGILPYAPRDLRYSLSMPIPGSAACIDQYAKQFSVEITDIFGHHFGEVTLWWLPRCSSHFGSVSYAGDYHNGIQLTVQLFRYPKASRWTHNENRQVIDEASATTEFDLWTPLVFGDTIDVWGCGSIKVAADTYSDCTAIFQGDTYQRNV